jgi:hypothetical protein
VNVLDVPFLSGDSVMNRISVLLVMIAFVIGFSKDAFAITQVQAEVAGVLGELGLEIVPSKVIGGPQNYKANDDSIKQLEKMSAEGTTIKVGGGQEFSAVKVAALKSLKLSLKEEPKNPGGNYVFGVTKETIAAVKGKVIILESDGKIKLK